VKKFAFLVAVAVVAGLIVALIAGAFSSDDGGTTTDSASNDNGGNKASAGTGGTVIQNGAGTVNDNTTTVEAAPNPNITPYGKQTDVPFEIENPKRHGVWALDSPVMSEWTDRTEQPENGVEWLAEGTTVRANCALASSTAYPVKIGEQTTTWHFFAELTNGTYAPMGGFKQATRDGAQGLRRCQSA
jgi:hypothetical protein